MFQSKYLAYFSFRNYVSWFSDNMEVKATVKQRTLEKKHKICELTWLYIEGYANTIIKIACHVKWVMNGKYELTILRWNNPPSIAWIITNLKYGGKVDCL